MCKTWTPEANGRCVKTGDLLCSIWCRKRRFRIARKLDEVYTPPQEVFQGLLEVQEIGEVVRDARLEFYEQVDVTALGVKVPAQDRVE